MVVSLEIHQSSNTENWQVVTDLLLSALKKNGISIKSGHVDLSAPDASSGRVGIWPPTGSDSSGGQL